jgi:hypothetical protein
VSISVRILLGVSVVALSTVTGMVTALLIFVALPVFLVSLISDNLGLFLGVLFCALPLALVAFVIVSLTMAEHIFRRFTKRLERAQ